MKRINTYDIDGVIYLGPDLYGVYPGEQDHIITGRSVDEEGYTLEMLRNRGIFNPVHFNPIPFEQKTRESSGLHKAKSILKLKQIGYEIGVHFEDDEIQIEVIKSIIPDLKIVHLVSNLVNKENQWNDDGLNTDGRILDTLQSQDSSINN
jgi:hypothetical protein